MKTVNVVTSAMLGTLLALIIIILSGIIAKEYGLLWAFTFVGAITIIGTYVVYKTIK